MILISINSCNDGSTGNIMCGISDVAKKRGITTYIVCPKSRSNSKKKVDNQIFIGSVFERNLHLLLSRITGYNGCFSHIGTFRFIKKLDKIKPDIIHLHNLHNSYINLPMLFRWIKKRNVKVIWTLHDCWAFTGQCPYFDMVNCEKWKTGCNNCPKYKDYPQSFVDRTRVMYKLKKKWFTGVKDLTVVTPSLWLAELVRLSFLKNYSVKVINNGINLDIFKPTEGNFRKENGVDGKKVIFGCASPWSERKGLDVFIKLADILTDEYKIVLVGLSQEQIKTLPKNIIGIEITNNQQELVKLYTMADLFVNPTREDNFPTTNIESIASGTPVITFNTGGSPEIIDEKSGCAVKCDDIDALICEILRVCKNKPYGNSDCISRAKNFDMHDKFREYVKLYEE